MPSNDIPRSQWISSLLRIGYKRGISAFNAQLQPLDLNHLHYYVLYFASRGKYNQRVVASMLGINENAVVDLVKELRDRKLIRQVPNPSNRREKFLRLSGDGMIVYADAVEIAKRCRSDLLIDFTEDEQEMFVRLLRRFAGEWMSGL